ncbi:MAG: hypothetical protein EB059_04525 [Alphaproteobacteria bacterium]|nr:hypothetical protein [Alphaproteobacteria bacterium]
MIEEISGTYVATGFTTAKGALNIRCVSKISTDDNSTKDIAPAIMVTITDTAFQQQISQTGARQGKGTRYKHLELTFAKAGNDLTAIAALSTKRFLGKKGMQQPTEPNLQVTLTSGTVKQIWQKRGKTIKHFNIVAHKL